MSDYTAFGVLGFEVPAGWVDDSTIAFRAPEPKTNLGPALNQVVQNPPQFTVQRSPRGDGMTAESYADDLFQQMQKGLPGTKISERRSVEVAGRDAYEVVLTAPTPKQVIRQRYVFVADQRFVYSIAVLSGLGDCAAADAAFGEILDSLSID